MVQQNQLSPVLIFVFTMMMLGKIEGRRRMGRQRMRWLDSITDTMDMSLSKLWGLVMYSEACLAFYSPWGRKESDTTE